MTYTDFGFVQRGDVETDIYTTSLVFKRGAGLAKDVTVFSVCFQLCL